MLYVNKITIIKYLIFFFSCLSLNLFSVPTPIGSDTAVSITPVSIVDAENIIKGFAWPKYGLKFIDVGLTCTYQSTFPISGPLDLNGGTLHLETDLVLTNTANIVNIGSIYGYGHRVELSENTHELNLSGNINYALILQARLSEARSINAVDWSYDNNYLSSVITGGAGNDIFVYYFDGSTFTKQTGADLGGNGYGVAFHPSAYYLAAVNSEGTRQLKLYQFTPPSTLTYLNTQTKNIAGAQALNWKPTGAHLAVGGTNNTNTIVVYSFATGTFSASPIASVNLATQDVSTNSICWAPIGNNYLAVGTTTDGANGELKIYQFMGTSLTLTAESSIIGQTISSLDWSPTGSYLAIGLSGGTERLQIYKHNVQAGPTGVTNRGKLTQVTTISESTTVSGVSWKNTGDELCISLLVNPTSVIRTYGFNGTTLSLNASLSATQSMNDVIYSRNGTYIARAGSSFLSIYKEISVAIAFDNTKLFLNSNLNLKTPISFRGNSVIDGQGNKLTFDQEGSINIKPNSILNFRNIILDTNDQSSIFGLEGQTAKLKFQDTTINLNSDVLFGDGSMEIDGNLLLTGPNQFTYATNYTSTINSFSQLTLANNAILSIGRSASKNYEPLVFTDNTSILELNDSTLKITNSGLKITKGKVFLSTGTPTLDINSTETNSGLIFGDGTSANDAELDIMGGTEAILTNGALIFNTYDPNKLIFNGITTGLELYPNTYLRLQKSLNLTDGVITIHPNPNLVKDTNAYLKTDNTKLSFLNSGITGEFYLTGTIDTLSHFILDQNDVINILAGSFDQTLTISRNGNTVEGFGGFNGQLNLINPHGATEAPELTWELPAKLDNFDLNLNNGSIFINNTSGFLHDYCFTGSGLIDLDTTEFTFGYQDILCTSSLYILCDAAVMKINAQFSLTGSWTFDGTITIDGNNNNLILSNLGNITLTPGTTLTLKNLNLKNLKGQNIKCLDNNCHLILDNVSLIQTGNFRFDKGDIILNNSINLLSDELYNTPFNFYYESTQTSTIKDCSNFTINECIVFYMGKRIGNTIVQPLEFLTNSSALTLNGGTLHITSSGAQLTKGKLFSSKNSTIYVEPTQLINNLYIGNGTESNDIIDDFKIEISGDSTLNLASGRIIYNNYQDDQLIFNSQAATLYINSLDGLYCMRDTTITNGTFRATSNLKTICYNPPGVTFYYDGITRIIDEPYSIQQIKLNVQRNTTTGYNDTYLNDEDYFYLQNGISPREIHIESGSANIGTSGSMEGQIYIDSPSATLNMCLNSTLKNNIYLNNGTLNLNSDLKFGSGNKIIGAGKIILNSNKIIYGTDELVFSDPVYFESASGFDIHAKTSLTNSWTFDGVCNLNGNGNILELGAHGKLAVRPNSTLYLTNINIKNIGSMDNGFILYDNSSSIHMSNVYFELDNNYSFTIGGIYVEGPATFGLKNYNWTFDTYGSLTVNGVTLWQDPLNKINSNNSGKIKFGTAKSISNYLELTNSGTIKTCTNLDLVISATNNIVYIYETEQTLNNNFNNYSWYKDGIKLSTNLTLETPEAIQCAACDYSTGINLNSNTLTLGSDLYLAEKTGIIGTGNINGTDASGTHAVILTGQTQLSTGNINIFGNLIIDGSGNNLDFNNQELLIANNKTLTLSNIILKNFKERSIEFGNSNSKLILDNVILELSGDYNFITGKLDIYNDLLITGTTKFIMSGGTITQYANSNLYFDNSTTFSVSGGTFVPNETSRIYFDACNIDIDGASFRINKGLVCFDNKVVVYGHHDLDLTTSVKVLSGARVELTGNTNLVI